MKCSLKYKIVNYIGLHITGNLVKFRDKTNEVIFISGRQLNFFNLNNKTNKLIDYGFFSFISSFDIEPFLDLLVICDIQGIVKIIDLPRMKILKKLILGKFSPTIRWSKKCKYIGIMSLSNIFILNTNLNDNLKNQKKINFYLQIKEFSNIIDFDWNKSGEKIIYITSDGYITVKNLTFYSQAIGIKIFVNFNMLLIKFSTHSDFYCLQEYFRLVEYRLIDKKVEYYLKNINNFNFSKYKSTKIDSFHLNKDDMNVFLLDYQCNILHYKLNILKNLNSTKCFEINYYSIFNFKGYYFNTIYSLSNYNFLILICYKNKKILNLDLNDRKIYLIGSNISNSITSSTVSANFKTLASGNEKGEIQLWLISKNICVLKYKIHIQSIIQLKFLKESSRYLISSSYDGTIKIMDLQKLYVVKMLNYNKTQFNCFDTNTSNTLLFSCSIKETKIFIWNLNTCFLLENIECHKSSIIGLIYLKRNKLLSVDKSGLIKVWLVELGKIFKMTCINFYLNQFTSISWNNDIKEICFLNSRNQIVLMNMNKLDTTKINISDFENFYDKKKFLNYIISVNYLKNGNLVLRFCNSKKIYVIDRKKIKISSKINLKIKSNKSLNTQKHFNHYKNSGFIVFYNNTFNVFQTKSHDITRVRKRTNIINVSKVEFYLSIKKKILYKIFICVINNFRYFSKKKNN